MSNTYRDKRRVKNARKVKEWLKKPSGTPFPEQEGPHHDWVKAYPHWWDTMFHHAPTRRHTRDKLKRAEQDPEADDGDWLDHKKPHKYYY